MASKLQQALGLSLDDYIAEKGIETGNARSRPPAKVPEANEGAFFKRQLRSEEDEEEDEDLLLMEDPEGLPMDGADDEDEMLGDNPPPLIPASKVDGEEPVAAGGDENNEPPEQQGGEEGTERTFITVEQKRGIRCASQQWRLRRDNQAFKKPAGLQPLLSVKSEFDRNTENLIASLGENAKFHNDESRSRIQDRLGRLGRQNNNNGRNNGDNFRNKNRNRNQFYGKPSVASFNPQRDRFQQQPIRGPPLNDLRPLLSVPNPLGGPVASALALFGQQPNSGQDRDKFSSAVQNAFRNHQLSSQQGLLGPAPGSCPTMMAPLAAANVLLTHMSTVQQNFGPKYDMKIQKEIHELQGKKMLYGTSGVVSTDGPGIEDERIRPVTTDLSMNMRFSSAVVEN